MRYRQYRFKFYLNASHAIVIGGHFGERHPHTWEIAITVLKYRENFVEFGEVEKRIEEFLEPYQNRMLNEVPPFDTINPTLENVCENFKDRLKELLNGLGWVLLKVEMSETPTRTYVINLLDETKWETKEQSVDTIADLMLEKIMEQGSEQ
ncbi:MAG: 6-carboxytetrahydropterin synthase [Lachnospiraceae bacterium]|nr:6-carboxytetrahydropterin synthase [Lachnospiraceae bacterium]